VQLNPVTGRALAHGRRLIALLAFALLLPAGLAAQAATTGQVSGRVLLATGEPLAAAQISATNVETGFVRGTLTRADGTFSILLLPPGTYTVRATSIGYQPAQLTQVRILAGGGATANFQLQVGAVQLEGIEVVASGRPISTTDASVSAVVAQEEIENLPSLGRDFTDFIALAGVVSPTPESTTGGQFSIAGQRPSQTNLQIDGVDANNSFFGENRGGSRIPFNFSLESIREFQVVTNGYDVEYGRYSGGVVNVVTRGGTNRFEGTVFGNLRNEALTGPYFTPLIVQGDTIRRPREYEVMQYGARVSGPILRDRMHYLVSVDGQRRREPYTPLTPDRFLDRGDTASFAAMNRFLGILQNQYGVANSQELFRPFLTTNDVLTLFGRVDYTINDAHRASLRHNFATYSNDNETFGDSFSGGLSTVESFENLSNSLVGELQSVLGPNTFNVFRFQYSSEARPRTAAEQRPEMIVNLPGGDLVRYGGGHIAFQNRLDERKAQAINNFTHQIGNHSLKLGGMALWTNVQNRFIGSQGAGIYRFNNLDDLENYRPASYTRRLRSDGAVPFADFDVVEWALYAQNEWRTTPRLTTTMGLRYDVQSFLNAPGRVVDVERAFGVRTGVAPTDRDNISPRLALAYNVFGDGRAVARGGVGYFYGPIPYVLGGNVAQTELPVLSLTCGGSIADGDANAPPSLRNYRDWNRASGSDNPIGCAGDTGLGGIPEYALWSESFEYPETFKANLGWEQQLLTNTRVNFDLVYTRSTKLYTVRNLNLREAQFSLANEGGRQIFTPAQHFTPSSGSAQTMNRRFTDFSNVFVNYNDGMSESTMLTTELVQRLGRRSSLRGSYTFSQAFDNSSFTCCTSFAGYGSPRVGAFGPNDVGEPGDLDRAWGPSDFNRPHTFVFSGQTALPFGLRMSGIWRMSSGTAWSPEQSGDLNGDGMNFNDRPFIFSPENLPVDPTLTAAQQQEHRDRYAGYLAEHACVGDYVGQIIPRNTCRNPMLNRLDMTLAYSLPTLRQQRAELVLDMFNVLNFLNEDWGQYRGVTSNRRNLLEPRTFVAGGNDPDQGRITYRVPTTFGERRELGNNLMLQWQAQIALRYRF
jgi:hypothetical protein